MPEGVGESVGTAPTGPLAGAVALCRPTNALLAGLLPIVGAYVAGALVARPLAALVAGVATAFGTAAGNAVNDYFDRDVDAVNAPGRPIPSGAIRPRDALVVATIAAAVAVVVTVAFLPVAALALGLVNLVVLLAYTPWLKGRYGLGNVAVAYLGGSAFLFGGLAVGSLAGVAVMAGLAASATLARELLKDVEDAAGDETRDLSTLAVALGPARATALGDACLVVTVLLSPLPYLTGTLGLTYLAIVAVADVLGVAAIVRSGTDVRASQQFVKYAMAVSVVAFVAGRVP